MSAWTFFKDVLRYPLQMGSVVPSSRYLARAIVDAAGICDGDSVVELGAGSGVFTREIVRRFPHCALVVIEMSESLGRELAREFPNARVIIASVESLPHWGTALGGLKFDRVVSGLPWALWTESHQRLIVDLLVPYLAPGCRLVTFHYWHSRLLGRVRATRRVLAERFVHVGHSRTIWANFPPAYVHIAEEPK